MKKYEYEKTLVLSTAHIKDTDDKLLHDFRTAGNGYGWTVMVDSDLQDQLRAWKSMGFSSAARNLLKLARKHNCNYLKLDCDGPVMDQLPKFDW